MITHVIEWTAIGARVVPRRTVRGLKSILIHRETPAIAHAGLSYPAAFNPHSAVSAVMPDGKFLGLKPGEFDFASPLTRAPTETILSASEDGGHPWVLISPPVEVAADCVVYRVQSIRVGARGWRVEMTRED